MKKLLPLLLFFPTLTLAGVFFDGFEEYYATLSGRLFTGETVELNVHSVVGNNYFSWNGTLEGRKRYIEVKVDEHDNLSFTIDNHSFKSEQVKKFPGEEIGYSDFGQGTVAYFASGWICLENTPHTASGTSVRRKSIYLMQLPKGRKPQAWKLPSLFGSCTGIRMQGGQIKFDKIEYRSQKDQDAPTGVSFHEYTIQGEDFVRTRRARRDATFVEPGNVYKFSLDEQ